MKQMEYKKAGAVLLDLLSWALGTLLYAVSVVCFVNPLKITSGGVTGVAIIINYFFPVLPIGILVYLVNVPLFIVSWKKFGIRFIINTVVATAFLSCFIDVLTPIAAQHGWCYAGEEKLLGAIFGGIIAGTGIGIVFLRGATTGGTDIMARLLRLKYPHIPVGKLVLLSDFLVVLCTGVVYKSVESILYSIVVIFLSGQAIDYVISGRDHSKMLMILTDFPAEVTAAVTGELHRGVSVINAKGGYTGNEKKMLICVVRAHEVNAVRKIISRFDEKPFIIITESNEVLGEGFKSHRDTL